MPGVSLRLLAVAVLVLAVAGAGLAVARRTVLPEPRALLARTVAELEAGNYHAAQDDGRAAIAAGANGPGAHVLLARTALALDDGLVAEAELDRAAATGATPAALHGWRAHARLLQGDPEGALAEARQAPRDLYALRTIARALAASGDPAGAQRVLLDLAAKRPTDAAVWTDLGRLRLTLGNVSGAADAAGRAAALVQGGKDGGEPAAMTLAGEVLRTRFGPEASLPWFAAALKRDARFHPALIEQAATLGDLGRHAAMLAATRRALASRPGSPQALYLRAVFAARAGRDDPARDLLRLAGSGIEGMPGVLLLGGGLDFRRGDYDQAVAKWQRLVEAQPRNVAARRLLGLALLRSGDAAGSVDVLRPAVLRADADGYTLRLAARGLERIGDRGGAAVLLDRAARGGGASTAFGSDTAVAALAAAAAEVPGDPGRQVELIRAMIGQGDAGGSVAQAQALIERSPGAAAARLALGDALIAAGRNGEAAAAYARAADLAFDTPTMLRLVDALGRTSQGRAAAATLSLFLRQNPRSIDARRVLGHWQVEAGDADAAIATLAGVLSASGGRDAGVLADLARAEGAAGRIADAVRHGRAAYRLAPMSPVAITAYAAALRLAGDAREAAQLGAKVRAIAGAGLAP